ncbi:Brix domain-containing protein [Trichinella pseudospiralis]
MIVHNAKAKSETGPLHHEDAVKSLGKFYINEIVVMSSKERPVGGLKFVRAIRREKAKELRTVKSKEKRKRVAERRKLRATLGEDICPVQQPKTLENTREYDETIVLPNDEEEVYEENTDEIAPYFQMKTKPKVLLTTSPKAKVVSWKLCYEFHRCIPNSHVIGRKGISLKRLISLANSKNYTDIVVVHEDRRSPNGLVLCHLPDGPTAYFKMQNVKLPKDIKNCGKGAVFGNPELVLNNFSTRLGHTVARMLACLFPQDPHFRGRRVVTFHNQRDYIFFRHHWYEFKKDGTKAALKELGPRFTLRLKALQKGTFNPKFGQFEWILKRHEMETSRRRFFL